MNAAYPNHITEPTAWTPDEFRDSDVWIRHFTDAEVAELLQAAETTGHQTLYGVSRERFPLPTLAAVLDEIAHELEHGRGFIMLRGLPVEDLSRATIDAVYAGLGLHLGRVITQNSAGARLGEVTDRGTDYGRQGNRGHTSNGQILPHCDSSDVVGLLCVASAAHGGESQIASATTVYNRIMAEQPELIEPLARGFRINLAGKGPTGDPQECTRATIPVFSYFAGRMSCRYNRKQIEDGARFLGNKLSQLERDAISAVGELAMREDVRLDMNFQPGDIQLLNNHCILHARAGYQDSGRQKRLLLRMWINTYNSRKLAPDFADRLNTGPRGEVAVRQ
tara:strand:- start:2607 stop:3614 length:1008 start_codon:yes stop_codon:yes gene_type:complete